MPKTPGDHETSGNKEVILVRMGQWREAEGDVTLETHNLGPCIGLAIYDPANKRGFLLHDPLPQDPHSRYNHLEDSLRLIYKGDSEGFSRLRAWISGGSSTISSRLVSVETVGQMEDFVAANRTFIEEAMEDIGIPKGSVEVHVPPENTLSASMVLDCSTGTCRIDFVPLQEP